MIASLNSARAKARDARRLSDIRAIQTALEMYYADYGRYPPSNSSAGCNAYTTVPNTSWCNSAERKSDGRWIANGALAPYLSQDPIDPNQATVPDFHANNDGGSYFYRSSNDASNGCEPGQFYLITAGMEVASNRQKTFQYCNGTSYASGGSYIVGKSIF